MSAIEFRPVDFSNLDEVVNLEVEPSQKHLVADNAYSVAQALLDPVGECRAIASEGRAVGFYYIRREETRIYICRFMIDRRWQGRGWGKRAMQQLVRAFFSDEKITLVDLAVSHELGSAEGFYRKCGFVSTGEPYKGGFRMVRTRGGDFDRGSGRAGG